MAAKLAHRLVVRLKGALKEMNGISQRRCDLSINKIDPLINEESILRI